MHLDPAASGRPLSVSVQGAGSIARFNVEVWELGAGGVRPRALTPQPQNVAQNQGAAHMYVIPDAAGSGCERLALIITRLDADEAIESVGGYRITLGTEADLGA